MQILVEEYGMLVIACVCASLFMVIIHMFLYGNNSAATVYKNDIVDVKVYSDEVSGLVLQYSPHFVASDNINDYKIPDRTFTKEMAMNIVKIYNDDEQTVLYDTGSKPDFENVAVLVTQYDLVMTNWLDKNGNASENGPKIGDKADCEYASKDAAVADGWIYLSNPVPIYTKVERTDKYGNRIWQMDGDRPKTWTVDDSEFATYDSSTQTGVDFYGIKHKVGERKAEMVDVLKYTQTYLGELGSDEFPLNRDADHKHKDIEISDDDLKANHGMPPRYKLVYRVQFGTKKAEFTTLLIKDN